MFSQGSGLAVCGEGLDFAVSGGGLVVDSIIKSEYNSNLPFQFQCGRGFGLGLDLFNNNFKSFNQG